VALFVGKLIIDEVVRQIGQAPPGPALSDWFASGRLTTLGNISPWSSRWWWATTS
jgi:hypothetical protein